jgi:hypothetical protein
MKVFPEVLINKCGDCPYCTFTEYLDASTCNHPKLNYQRITEEDAMPDWCLLEDKEQL